MHKYINTYIYIYIVHHVDRLGVRVVDGRRHGDEGERVRHDLVIDRDMYMHLCIYI